MYLQALGTKLMSLYRDLVTSGKDTESAYWELVVKDIQDACKLFEHIYDETDGGDGYVSVEVSPKLANDTNGTVEAAKWLHKVVDRPNVYIKIPATAECVPSVQQVISLGISVNVTVSSISLLFLLLNQLLFAFYSNFRMLFAYPLMFMTNPFLWKPECRQH